MGRRTGEHTGGTGTRRSRRRRRRRRRRRGEGGGGREERFGPGKGHGVAGGLGWDGGDGRGHEVPAN